MDPEDDLAQGPVPEETDGDDPWHEEGWYFDLPVGAWERQEAKNRVLRDNIRANVNRETSLRAMEARRDPFHGRDALLGLAQHADGPAWGEEMDDAPVSQQASETWMDPESFENEEPGSWKAELPDRRNRTTWQEEEPEPEWGAPEDFERRTGPRRAGAIAKQHGPDGAIEGDREWAPAPLRPREFELREAPMDEEHGDGPGEPDNLTPKRTKWDEMFGGPPETSIIEAMRDWTTGAKDEERKARDLTELPSELLQPFDWEEADVPGRQQPEEPAIPAVANEERRAGTAREQQEEPAEAVPLAIVEQSALDASGWDTFASASAPTRADTGAEPERKPMRLGKLFGRGAERRAEREAMEWSADPAAIMEMKAAKGERQRQIHPEPPGTDVAALTGWEPAEQQLNDDAIGGDGAPGTRALDATARGASGPGPGAWGAPPSDEDGSLKYELPRRFTDRDVWDDEWFERPPSDERVPQRPPRMVRDTEAAGAPQQTDVGGADVEATGERLESGPRETADPAATVVEAFDEAAEAETTEPMEAGGELVAEPSEARAGEVTEHGVTDVEPFAAAVEAVPDGGVAEFLFDGEHPIVAPSMAEPEDVTANEGGLFADPEESVAAKSKESPVGAGADAEAETGDAGSYPWGLPANQADRPADEVLVVQTDLDVVVANEAGEEPAQRRPVDDDPWAAFLVARESDEPLGFRFTSDRDSRLAS
ncbi:MAG: hypothetical protein R3B97_17305 [Dehalococcoidia bacterium]|nr:hypothetical protein [Dehalococcoidia bacterium]